MVVEVSPDLNISSSTWPKQNQLQRTETEHTPVLHTKLEEKLIFTHSTFSNCPTSCTHTHTRLAGVPNLVLPPTEQSAFGQRG